MAKKTETATIDGETYEITQLGGLQNLDIFQRSAGRISAAMVEANKKTTTAERAAAGVDMLASFPPGLFEEMRKAFTDSCKVKAGSLFLDLGKGDIWDQHFAGRPLHAFAWFYKCMQVNFSDFLFEQKPGASPDEAPAQSS